MQKIFLPHRDAAQTTWQWFTVCVAIAAFLLASAELALDGGDDARWAMASSIDCRHAASSAITLTNAGPAYLSQGQSVAWLTRGTPAPEGELPRSPEDLAPGRSLQVDATQPISGSGCMPRVLR